MVSADLLRQVPLFSGLDEEAIESLLSVISPRKYNKDAVIFFESDPGDAMFMIVSGRVKVTILSDVSERAADIDVDRARASLEAAEAALADDPDDEAAASARTRARLRLRVAGAEEAAAH